jgi:hypothetical protein
MRKLAVVSTLYKRVVLKTVILTLKFQHTDLVDLDVLSKYQDIRHINKIVIESINKIIRTVLAGT